MPLVKATLEAEIRKLIDPDDPLFSGWPPDTDQAAANWAAAYDLYASQATDVSGDPVLTKFPNLFELKLAGDPGPPPEPGLPDSDEAAEAADIFDRAFVAYWTGAIFVVGVPPPPTGIPCPNVGGTGIFSVETTSVVSTVTSGMLKALLEIEFASKTGAGSDKAVALANIFDAVTKAAVLVLITGLDTTVPTPVPITNTCTIF